MVFSEYYPSFKDIEPEYLADIKELIAQDIPSTDYLQFIDELFPHDINYHLIFEEASNAPIGLIRQVRKTIHHQASKKSIIHRILLKDSYETSLNFQTPGITESGFFCKPHQRINCLKYIESYILKQRDPKKGLKQISVNLSANDALNFSFRFNGAKWSKPTSVIKAHKEFREYFQTLSSNIKELLTTEENEFNSNSTYSFKTFNYSDIQSFANKEKLQFLLKTCPEIENQNIVGIQRNDEIISFYIFYHGYKNNLYVKYFFGASEKSFGYESVLVKHSMESFYRDENFYRLKLLNSTTWPIKIKEFFYDLKFNCYKGKTSLISPRKKELRDRSRA